MLIQAFLMGSLFGLLTITAMAHSRWRVQLHGRTLDSETGEPVFCTLEVYDRNGEVVAQAESNAQGNFAIFVPSSKDLEIRVAENGYRGKTLSLRPIPAGKKYRHLDVDLMPWK